MWLTTQERVLMEIQYYMAILKPKSVSIMLWCLKAVLDHPFGKTVFELQMLNQLLLSFYS